MRNSNKMITVQLLRQYLKDKLVQIPALKSEKLIIDDSELSKFLKDMKVSDSPMLIGVMPAYPIQGDEDSTQWENKLMFMILDKTPYRDTDHEAYLDIFEATQALTRQFVEQMLAEKENSEGLFCSQMVFLQENSANVYPIWKKQGCNGWAIEIDVLTNL